MNMPPRAPTPAGTSPPACPAAGCSVAPGPANEGASRPQGTNTGAPALLPLLLLLPPSHSAGDESANAVEGATGREGSSGSADSGADEAALASPAADCSPAPVAATPDTAVTAAGAGELAAPLHSVSDAAKMLGAAAGAPSTSGAWELRRPVLLRRRQEFACGTAGLRGGGGTRGGGSGAAVAPPPPVLARRCAGAAAAPPAVACVGPMALPRRAALPSPAVANAPTAAAALTAARFAPPGGLLGGAGMRLGGSVQTEEAAQREVTTASAAAAETETEAGAAAPAVRATTDSAANAAIAAARAEAAGAAGARAIAGAGTGLAAAFGASAAAGAVACKLGCGSGSAGEARFAAPAALYRLTSRDDEADTAGGAIIAQRSLASARGASEPAAAAAAGVCVEPASAFEDDT
jgi:hypothetical protein